MSRLAILGGTPVNSEPLAPFNKIGDEELRAVEEVVRSGVLSGFVATSGEGFDGGPAVQELERRWCALFGVGHSVTVNSATSGLIAAMGAVGVGPGDEVIVPPYTMSATVMAPLFYGGIPVFVDIDPDTYCLDAELVRAAITPKTRAIIAVNLFGLPAALAQLRALSVEHGLYLVEDNAQAPLATENGRYAGTVGHIGVFSLNRHKHIQSGEGGVCTTDDDALALRLRLIRNHGEVAAEELDVADLTNLIGFNFRLTELCAAVAVRQLDKLAEIVDERVAYAHRLSAGLSGIQGFTPPHVPEARRHVFYSWAGRYDEREIGVRRAIFAEALKAEGFPAYEAYIRPLYLLPAFRYRVAIGRDGFPFNLTERAYGPGLCPVCERLYDSELLGFPICSYALSTVEIDRMIEAFHKVHEHRDALHGLNAAG